MFHFVIFIILIMLFSFKRRHTDILILSCFLLFLIWGLNYNMTTDWLGYLQTWNRINESSSDIVTKHGDTAYEPMYIAFIRFTKPIGFMGFQILVVAILLMIVFYSLYKFVLPKYYWLSFYVLICLPGYGLLYVNSLRQTLALCCCVISTILLVRKDRINIGKEMIFSILLIYLASMFHASAIVTLIVLPLYFIVEKIKIQNRIHIILISNILFFSRFFVDLSEFELLFSDYLMDTSVEGFMYATSDLEPISLISPFETFYHFIILNLILLYYDKLSFSLKFMSLLVYVSMLANGFMINTLSRLLCYFNFYLIIVAPILLYYFLSDRRYIFRFAKFPTLFVIFAYTMFAFLRSTLFSDFTYYSKWGDYESIFSAPYWM